MQKSYFFRTYLGITFYLVDWALLPPLLGVGGGALGGVDDDDHGGGQHAHPGQPEQHKQRHPQLHPEGVVGVFHQFLF